MFRRRTPRTLIQKIREMIWPSMGWARFFHYVKNRILRLSDTPHNISLGLALGAAVSFSPFMGTHIIQAILFAFITRANIIAATLGTLIGNPWTFPFIWLSSITLGQALFSKDTQASMPEALSLSDTWILITQDPLSILLPWAVGGYMLALISLPLYYMLFLNLLRGALKAKRTIKKQTIHNAGKDLTKKK